MSGADARSPTNPRTVEGGLILGRHGVFLQRFLRLTCFDHARTVEAYPRLAGASRAVIKEVQNDMSGMDSP